MIVRALKLPRGRFAVARSSTFTSPSRRRYTSQPDVDDGRAASPSIESSPNSSSESTSRVVALNDPNHPVAQDYQFFLHQRDRTDHLGATTVRPYRPHETLSNPPSAKDITLELLVASQSHLGHSTSLWHPGNAQYIFGVRGEQDPIHIISPDVTAAHLRRACRVVSGVTERGGLVLFVGTRDGQSQSVVRAAQLAQGCHLFNKWTPGTITNGQQILAKCETKVVNQNDEEIPGFEEQLLTKPVLKPDLVVCLNTRENYVLLHECGLNNIPTIGVVDTDVNPTWVTYPIAANDDSLRCIQLIAGVLGRAGQEGQQRRLQKARDGIIGFARTHGLTVPDFRSRNQNKTAQPQKRKPSAALREAYQRLSQIYHSKEGGQGNTESAYVEPATTPEIHQATPESLASESPSSDMAEEHRPSEQDQALLDAAHEAIAGVGENNVSLDDDRQAIFRGGSDRDTTGPLPPSPTAVDVDPEQSDVDADEYSTEGALGQQVGYTIPTKSTIPHRTSPDATPSRPLPSVSDTEHRLSADDPDADISYANAASAAAAPKPHPAARAPSTISDPADDPRAPITASQRQLSELDPDMDPIYAASPEDAGPSRRARPVPRGTEEEDDVIAAQEPNVPGMEDASAEWNLEYDAAKLSREKEATTPVSDVGERAAKEPVGTNDLLQAKTESESTWDQVGEVEQELGEQNPVSEGETMARAGQAVAPEEPVVEKDVATEQPVVEKDMVETEAPVRKRGRKPKAD